MGWEQALQPIGFFLFYRVLKEVVGWGYRRLYPPESNPPETEEADAGEGDGGEKTTKKTSEEGDDSKKGASLEKEALTNKGGQVEKAVTNKKKKKKNKGEDNMSKKKKGEKPGKKKESQPWKALAIVSAACAAAGCACGFAYYRYGPMFFLSPKDKRLTLESREWQALLSSRSVCFVGGHHRSGTTAVWRAIASHDKVAWFGEERECGLDFSEGAFAQDAYPRFGVGVEFAPFSTLSGQTAGVGRYALGDPEEILWTEERATLDAQARVLNSFGFYWKRKHGSLESAKVFLEKSPPNVVLARYLQALIDLKDESPPPDPSGFDAAVVKPLESRARFVFVTRHPIANAVSHQRFPGAKTLSTAHLVAHWLAVEHYAETNAKHLAFLYRIRLEAFAENPADILLDVWRFLDLVGAGPENEAAARLAAQDAASRIKPDPNSKHRKDYCQKVLTDRKAARSHASVVRTFAKAVNAYGYDLDTFCQGIVPPVLTSSEAGGGGADQEFTQAHSSASGEL